MGVFEDVLAQSSRKPEGLPGVLERRRHKRVPTRRSSTTGLTSHLWELELVPAFGLIRLCDDIDRLAKCSVDENLFFEGTVLRSAWPRLTNLLAPHGVWMLCLWETTGEGRSLRFFMPVRMNKVGFPRKRVIQPLSHVYIPVGTPLIDKDCAEEAVETLFRLLADPALKFSAIVEFTHQRKDCRSFELLADAAQRLGLATRESNTHERAALFANQPGSDTLKTNLGKKRLRELARQRRKLEALGTLTLEFAQTEEQVLDAFERFMTLELKGWKGRRGSALYNHRKIAAFSRQIVAGLATDNCCEIFSLIFEGKTIASLIMLGRDGRLAPWKMAFDENMGAYSPGMQIMLQVSNDLVRRAEFVEADSLAVSDHWMMNRIWSDRILMTDWAVALTPDAEGDLTRFVAAKNRLALLKSTVKAILSHAQSFRAWLLKT